MSSCALLASPSPKVASSCHHKTSRSTHVGSIRDCSYRVHRLLFQLASVCKQATQTQTRTLLQVLAPLLPQVFKLLFGVLTSRRSHKTTIGFLLVLSRMICMQTPDTVLPCMEAGSAGSSKAVFTEVLPNNIAKIGVPDDKRIVAVATTRVLCESDTLLSVRPALFEAHVTRMTYMELQSNDSVRMRLAYVADNLCRITRLTFTVLTC